MNLPRLATLSYDGGHLTIDRERLLWYRDGDLAAIIPLDAPADVVQTRERSFRHPRLGLMLGSAAVAIALVGLTVVVRSGSYASVFSVYRGGPALIGALLFGSYLLC